MHQRKEKTDRASQSNQEAVLQLLPLLEGTDYETIKNLIQENLCETKDSRLLFGIVDYYMTVQSQRSLSVLLRLKEPHDKNLFDKISELMKMECSRYKSLQLLCNLVYKQPSWLYKISNHRVMNTLLNLLKTDTNAPNLMSGLFVLICLLPMIPSQFGPFLTETFGIFSRLAEWNMKKPSFIVDIYMVHLNIVIYTLFHRLYGMFPCNFLAYLRSYYGGRDCTEDNFKVFTSVIKPMLERVRLHPLLVTASKETELSTGRWKKMSYHDIIVDCASISLDAVEGTRETVRRKNNVASTSFEQNVCSYESSQFVSYNGQSSSSINFESDSLTNDLGSSHELTRTPSSTLSTIPASSSTTSPSPMKGEQDLRSYSSQISTEEIVPLDFAIEAKPEVLKIDLEDSNAQPQTTKGSKNMFISSTQGLKDSDNTSNNPSLSSNDIVLPAVEAKEDDIDKEVSELTSLQNFTMKMATDEARLDTPFCSTTQNLTDEPGDLPLTVMSNSERSDSLPKSNDEEVEEMFNSMQDTDMETDVPPFNRFRYFSHCGPPPVIPLECIQKPKVIRSSSCPADLYPSEQINATNGKFYLASESVVVTCSSSTITTSSAFVPVPTGTAVSSIDGLITYQDLIPIALNSIPDVKQRTATNFGANFSQVLYLSSLSPPELLDHYIQQGNIACSFNQLGTIPITSTNNTDWTHFGGKPPPDEITILRNQILLLHNQLLFERHRKDVHSERNRRILGRAKRFRMQEEHIIALTEQIKLLEQDKTDYKIHLSKQQKLHDLLQIEKQQVKNDLLSRISKAEQENAQLLFSNKNLQNLLVSQKQENDEIREICKRSQTEIRTLKQEIEYAGEESIKCQKLVKENAFLTKQLVLFQELVNHCKDKIEVLRESQSPDIGIGIAYDAARFEIKDLKQKLEGKSFLLDTMKTKIADLEQAILNMKAIQQEQRQAFEKMQSLHKDEIAIREERLKDFRKVSIQKDAHILSLQKDIENLLEDKSMLRKQINGDRNSVDHSEDAAHMFLQNSGVFNNQLPTNRGSNLEPRSHSDEDVS